MKMLDLKKAAEEFEIISSDTQLFYNIETGEFDYYSDFMDIDDADAEKFEDDAWICAPRQYDINEYDIMVDFTDTVTDPRKNELLSVSLEGRGAFRRFKDTLHRVGLVDEWYSFKHKAFMEIAREWCEENDIEYLDDTKTRKQKPVESADNDYPSDVIIIPLVEKIAEGAAEILREVFPWCYGGKEADQEVRRMLTKKRVALVAIVDTGKKLCLAGIIGAIPQYSVTGWELHPLAVLNEYRGRGFGKLLMEALEHEVAARGGVMIYLGSDDEFGGTSLFGVDLYQDTFGKIANIQNTGGHPYSFYEKMGYKIVGVLPDANGIGKPDIWMAKRIRGTRATN